MGRSRAARSLSSLLGLAALALAGCSAEAPPTPAPAPVPEGPGAWLALASDRVLSARATGDARIFDAVATDVDLDGDADLLLNWHHMAALELFENRAGIFHTMIARESGLGDAPGIASIFASTPLVEAALAAKPRAGLSVWHDAHRYGSWRFVWQPDGNEGNDPSSLELSIELSLGVESLEGLDASEVEHGDARHLTVSLPASSTRSFALTPVGLSAGLRLSLRPSGTAAAPPLHIGSELVTQPTSDIELWLPDPHGIAWIDVAGSPEPDLYLTRGALASRLKPPAAPKRDRFFVSRPAAGQGTRYAWAGPERFAAGYRRGRAVEWVDVDVDGLPELFIAAKSSANALLATAARDAGFVDRAEALGLDLADGEVTRWGDLDGDGLPDLFVVTERGVEVWRNAGASSAFERIDAATLGLVFAQPPRAKQGLFDTAALQLADFDRDGRLDVWVLGHGADGTNHLFRRRAIAERTGENGAEPEFEDISWQTSLGAQQGTRVAVLVDLEADADLDLLCFGDRGATLLRNVAGERFEALQLPDALVPESVHAALAADVDGDGDRDIVMIGRQRHLLLDRSDPQVDWLAIEPVKSAGDEAPPLGAEVRVVYADGTSLVQRYGATDSTAFSQGLLPLAFASPAENPAARLCIRWPGETSERLHATDAARPRQPQGELGGCDDRQVGAS